MKMASILVPGIEMVNIGRNTTSFPSWIRILRALVGMLGVAIFLCAVLDMRDSWCAGVSKADKTELVTCEIYRFGCNSVFFEFCPCVCGDGGAF